MSTRRGGVPKPGTWWHSIVPMMQDRSHSDFGASEVRHDVVTQAPLDRLAALLDRDAGLAFPPLGHWLFTLPDAPQSALGDDGHPAHGLVVPPPGLPRRMWAGSRIALPGVLRPGDDLERRSTLASVVDKGAMTFVTVRHEIRAAGTLAVVEEQDLVYLPARTGPDTAPPRAVAVPEAASARVVTADAAMLFRFSALTFNAHRIHYDRDYAQGVEHYPGLVVHGPLLATLLVDDALRLHPGGRVVRFDFRARSPVFDGERFELCSAGDTLWVRTAAGIAMTAEIAFA